MAVPTIVSHATGTGSSVTAATVTIPTVPAGSAVYVGVVVGSAGPTDPSTVADSVGNVYTKIAALYVGDSYRLSVWMVDGAVGGTNVVVTVTTGFTQSMAMLATVLTHQVTPSLDPASPATGVVASNPIELSLTPSVAAEVLLFFLTVNASPATFSPAGLGSILDQAQSSDTTTSICAVWLSVTDTSPHTLGADSSPLPTTNGGGALVGVEGVPVAAPSSLGRTLIRPGDGSAVSSRKVAASG